MDARIRDLPLDTAALHALHFGSLGGDGATMAPAMELALDANFGGVDTFMGNVDWAAGRPLVDKPVGQMP